MCNLADDGITTNGRIGGSLVFDEATRWDYAYDQDKCPDCGEMKRKVSARCHNCDTVFRSRLYNNLQQFLRGLREHRAGKRVVLRFVFPD